MPIQRRHDWPGWSMLGGALVPVALLGIWSILSVAALIPADRLPSPAAVIAAGADLAGRGVLLQDLAASGQRVLRGFAFGSATGLALGMLVGLSQTASVLLTPFLAALRAVPSLAWLPLLLLSLGIGEAPKVALIAIGAALPVFATLAGALRPDDADERPRTRALLPVVVGALRQALAQSWLFMVGAELLDANTGLGFLLIQSSNGGRVDRLVFTIILLAILARLGDAVLGVAERALRRRLR